MLCCISVCVIASFCHFVVLRSRTQRRIVHFSFFSSTTGRGILVSYTK